MMARRTGPSVSEHKQVDGGTEMEPSEVKELLVDLRERVDEMRAYL